HRRNPVLYVDPSRLISVNTPDDVQVLRITPRPFHKIIVCEDVQTRIIRRFENLGITQENPDAYIARYGSTLLSPTALVQEARRCGVTEDI
ncbi:unnamed protein product, partial [Rotaria sp. Silwood1]